MNMFNPNQYTFDEIVKLASVGEQALIKYADIKEFTDAVTKDYILSPSMPKVYKDQNAWLKNIDKELEASHKTRLQKIKDVATKPNEKAPTQSIKDVITKGWESTKSGAKAVWNNPYGKAAVIGGGSLAGLYALIKALSSKKKEDEDDKKKTKKTASFKKRADEAPKTPERNTNLQNAGIAVASGATVGLIKKLLQSAFDKDADNSLASYLKNIGGYGLVGGGIGLGVNSAKDIIKDWKAKNEKRIEAINNAKNTPLTIQESAYWAPIPNGEKLMTVDDIRKTYSPEIQSAIFKRKDTGFIPRNTTVYDENKHKFENPDLAYSLYAPVAKYLKNLFTK